MDLHKRTVKNMFVKSLEKLAASREIAHTLSNEVAMAERSLQMEMTTSTQVGSSSFMQMIAKKKNPVRIRLDAIPAKHKEK